MQTRGINKSHQPDPHLASRNASKFLACQRSNMALRRQSSDLDVVMLSPGMPAGSGSDQRTPPGQPRWQPRLVVQSLILPNARPDFAHSILDIYGFWLQLLRNTTLPRDIQCTDASVIHAFQNIDQIINNDSQLSRLAFVQLARFMTSLRGVVAVDRKHGRIHTTVGYRNASVALDIYIKAQTQFDTPEAFRKKLNRRVRIAKRWDHLGGSSPLLLIVHSHVAGQLV